MMGCESVLREKEVAIVARLAATEIVRRCERRVAVLVRQGQAEGRIRRQGQTRLDKTTPVKFEVLDKVLYGALTTA
jgi:hypothetical protein